MRHFLPNPTKFSQSYYELINPEKYQGALPIRCLSSWETKVCQMFDLNPSVLYWASEPMAISYINPVKTMLNKRETISKYYPDYVVIYVDKFGKKHKEIVEVKPAKQAFMEMAKTRKEKIDVMVNTAKWNAARAFASKYGYTFRILTEYDIFSGKR
jgi:hypothetical protein